MATSSVLFVAVLAPAAASPQSGDDHPVTAAFEKCSAAGEEVQLQLVEEITRRIELSEDEGVGELLKLRARARAQLELVPVARAQFYDPETYARGQRVRRRFVDRKSSNAEMQVGIYRPWESELPFAGRVRYDLARDQAVDTGQPVLPIDQIWNFLYGYPPDADLLVAWLQQRFDHDESLDLMALHFSHAYCDLFGSCYQDITLYDAFASREQIDMPDVDVIPYAELILKDHSFRSPIPADARRVRLYGEIRAGFLRYFQHRTLVEAAATLYLDPEVPLRPEHEGLRARLLYLFGITAGDVEQIRDFLKSAIDRAGFLVKVDARQLDDTRWEQNRRRYGKARNASRWAIAEATYSVLREKGFLEDGS